MGKRKWKLINPFEMRRSFKSLSLSLRLWYSNTCSQFESRERNTLRREKIISLNPLLQWAEAICVWSGIDPFGVDKTEEIWMQWEGRDPARRRTISGSSPTTSWRIRPTTDGYSRPAFNIYSLLLPTPFLRYR